MVEMVRSVLSSVSELEHEIAAQCKEMTTEDLASVIDLRVPTNEGVLYLGYKSPEDTAA